MKVTLASIVPSHPSQEIDTGFEMERLASMGLNPGGIGYEPGQAENFFDEVLDEDDIEEMGDLLNCLVHFCIQKNWSMEDVSEAMLPDVEEKKGLSVNGAPSPMKFDDNGNLVSKFRTTDMS